MSDSTPNQKPFRSAAEVIAFHLSSDIRDVTDYRYQERDYPVAVYSLCDGYMCAPSAKQKMPDPKRWDWKPLATYRGRTVYFAEVKKLEDSE